MENDAIRFACNGCGVCCKGRLIPLTLNETRQWLQRGHDVSVILEAFNETLYPTEPAKFIHSALRSTEVDSGAAKIRVIAILAANALTQCPNLDDQDRCGIYEARPLVCRIYPMEISPFISLNPAQKACPPEVWDEGEIIFTDRIVGPMLASQVDQSREADRNDAGAKVAICESMGMTTAAWKENALAIYLPERAALIDAIQRYDAGLHKSESPHWRVRVDDQALRQQLRERGVEFDASGSSDYIFHKL